MRFTFYSPRRLEVEINARIRRVLCQTRCPDLGFGKHGHLNNGALFEAEREERRDRGKVYTRVTPGECAFSQEGANLPCTSGRV